MRRAAVAGEAVPIGQQVSLQNGEDAEQSGSRQALLSTAQGIERIAGDEVMQPLVEEQPWKGIDTAAGASRAPSTPPSVRHAGVQQTPC